MTRLLRPEDFPDGKIPPENPLRVIFESFKSLDLFFKLTIISAILFILVIPFAVEGLIFDIRQEASDVGTSTYDLKSYYPNPDKFENSYLEGKNNANSTRSVLWFEPQDLWSFKLYNSAPDDPVYARCNWDLLSWWNDGFLRYAKTHHDCPGVTPNEVVFDPPIIFLPRMWNSATPWSHSATTNTKFYQNNVLKCEGTLNYKGEIVGIEEIVPGEKSIHWRTTQTTNWTSGNVAGSCAAGYTTNWQEDYWLTDALPVQSGGNSKGLRKSKGGNKDITTDNWDVWFDEWRVLPSTNVPSSMPSPSLTPTAIPTLTPRPPASPTPIPTPTPFPTKSPAPTSAPIDKTPPKISLSNPSNGSIILRNSTINILATASDNVKVSKVVFYVNGAQKCIDTLTPYRCSWRVPSARNTNYTLSAFAFDDSNNAASSFIQVKSK